ncbi:MAG: hypothetical protein DYG92_04365 [Leptolyngbya sp. PLA1]|nr:hypothetical protein [Leptolyngbya sp. PLA1]
MTPQLPRRQPGPSLHDLTASLLWPLLLRAGALALRPARLCTAAVLLVLVTLIMRLPDLWLDEPGPASVVATRALVASDDIREGTVQLDPSKVMDGVVNLLARTPAAVAERFPWSIAAITLPILLFWGVLGAAISRSAAREVSLRDRGPWTADLAFGLSKWHSAALIKLGPILAFGACWGLVACLGWLLSFQVVQIGVGVLYPIGLILSLACVVVGLCLLGSVHMLIPAVACEGTDAIDALQRCVAYALAKPLKLITYGAILIAQAVVLTIVLHWIVEGAISACVHAATAWVAEPGAEAFRSAAAGKGPAPEAWSPRTASALVGFWSSLLRLGVGAFLVSFWFCGGTVQFLLMRRVCDGQDVEELWTPGAPASPQSADVPESNDADYA